jgi:hypothetical protein
MTLPADTMSDTSQDCIAYERGRRQSLGQPWTPLARWSFLILAAALLAASGSAAAPLPESVVEGIYAAAAQHIGRAVTPLAALHLSSDFSALITRAEAVAAKGGEPFIESDLALDCKDCTSFSGVAVARSTGPAAATPKAGHVWVEARFTINGEKARRVLFDMVAAPEGWRVDNIVSGGSDLRAEAQSYLASAPAP